MLKNIFAISELGSLARRLKEPDVYESIRPASVEEYLANGWTKAGINTSTVRMRKNKLPALYFEHRVWKLLYDLQFPFMSGRGGTLLETVNDDGPQSREINVVAYDDDVALCVTCNASDAEAPSGRRIDINELASLRAPFARALPASEKETRRKVASILWTYRAGTSEDEKKQAELQNVKVFDEVELAYYEQLVSQIGIAAKYQLLADVYANSEIPGLKITVPAIRIKLGKATAYTFPIQPENLLRIAYVSHRSKGKVTDVDTYQRLIKKSRLKAIRKYIDDGGYFPSNIVVNIASSVVFQKAENPRGYVGSKGDFGWLHLPPRYKSAWIIDGQHRLFSYSGSNAAEKSEIIVLAFSGLAPSEQAKLFVDINGEQKSVKQNLLVELWAELFWDSPDVVARAKAVISKTILSLDAESDSPLLGRVLKADDKSTNMRCISLQTLTAALNKPEFFIGMSRKVATPGAFWAADNDATRRRASRILKTWLRSIAEPARQVWEKGRDAGGGLAMNDGVTIILNVCRSVLRHLSEKGCALHELDDTRLAELIEPYGACLGKHFAAMPANEMTKFRALRGGQGHGTGTRLCQAVLLQAFPDFKPAGLEDFIELQAMRTSEEAQQIASRIEVLLHKTIVAELKEEYGADEAGWWFKGIPVTTRVRIDKTRNEQGVPRARETMFNLIEFREVVHHNWSLFGDLFGKGTGKKDDKTKWFVKLNDIRNFAAHPVNGPVPREDVEYLETLETWLKSRITVANTSDAETSKDEDSLIEQINI